MPFTPGQSGNPAGGRQKYKTDEERKAAQAASRAKWAMRRAVELDPLRADVAAKFNDMAPVSVSDPLNPVELERALKVEANHDTLLHLGRLGERVALAKLIESVLDEKADPKIRAANMRALLQGWSAAPKQSINLQVNTEKLDASELIELGRRMFASPAIDITPTGAEPSGLELSTPLESDPT